MKKLVVMVVFIATTVMSFAQVRFGMSGDVQFATKNASTGTGLIFSEDPAVILHANPSIQFQNGKWSVTAFYSGQVSLQCRYHIVDLLASYKINDEFSIYVGPEFTYKDAEIDAVGSGLVGMVTWNKKKFESTFIFYADSKFKSFYYIGSASYKITSEISIYGLAAYTNAEPCPYYGLVGLKYSKGNFFASAYYSIRKDTPGPIFQVGIKF
jgi:hypothetical protein